MVRVIIFDYDDTLVNSSKALYKIEVRVIKSMSLKVPSEKEYFSLWGLPHSSMIKSMFPNISINEYMKRYSDIYNPDSIKPFNNVSGKSHIIYGWDESESQKGI